MRWTPFANVSPRWRTPILILFIACAGWAIVRNVKLARFMIDHTFTQGALVPAFPLHVTHNCTTSYLAAVRTLDSDPTIFPYKKSDAYTKSVTPAPFKLDGPPHNPPPFLLLPRAVGAGLSGAQFLSYRLRWYVFELLLCATIFIAIAWQERRRYPLMFALAPLFFASNPWIENLQWGNFQIGMAALFVGGVWCIANERERLGGVLLGLAIVAHIHPGIVGIPLLLQRRWRAVVSAALTGTAALALSIAVDGWALNREYFFHYLPHLLGSDVDLSPTKPAWAVLVHYSVWGFVRRLSMLGLPISYEWAHRATQLAAIPVLGLAVWLGLRGRRSSRQELIAWVGLMTLMTVQNPHFWPYALIVPAFLAWMLLSDAIADGRAAAIVCAIGAFYWIALKTQFWTADRALPVPGWMLAVNCVFTLMLIATGVWAIVAPPRAEVSAPPAR